MTHSAEIDAPCGECGAPIVPYLYAGETRWKHADGMPHGHAAAYVTPPEASAQ